MSKKLVIGIIFIVVVGIGIILLGVFLYRKQSFLVFTAEEQYPVQVYFFDEASDPKHKVCTHVVPFERMVKASKIGVPLRTLELLFAGPTLEEKKQGAYSAIPPDTTLFQFEINDEVTNVVINYDFKRGDPCARDIIERQIKNTLMQFNDIPPVKINSTQLIIFN